VRCAALVLLCLAGCPSTALAQVKYQQWFDGTIDWLASDTLTFELDSEPKTNPATFKLTPHADYAILPWADVLAEADIEHQADTDTSFTPRVGVQLHILSRLLRRNTHTAEEREKPPLRRLVVSTLLRIQESDSNWKSRNRFAVAYPFNRRKTTDDGAVYFTADAELFLPLDRAAGAARVDEVRIRSGFGYRANFPWRFELLYIWDGTRRADNAPLTPNFNALDVRVRWQF
jgi:Protein of unknown function (DUF2490)